MIDSGKRSYAEVLGRVGQLLSCSLALTLTMKRAPWTLHCMEGHARSFIYVPQAQKVVARGGEGGAADLFCQCFRATIGNEGVRWRVLVGTFEIWEVSVRL